MRNSIIKEALKFQQLLFHIHSTDMIWTSVWKILWSTSVLCGTCPSGRRPNGTHQNSLKGLHTASSLAWEGLKILQELERVTGSFLIIETRLQLSPRGFDDCSKHYHDTQLGNAFKLKQHIVILLSILKTYFWADSVFNIFKSLHVLHWSAHCEKAGYLLTFHHRADSCLVRLLLHHRHPHITSNNEKRKWIYLRCFILAFLSAYTDCTSVYLWADNKWGCQLGHKMLQR